VNSRLSPASEAIGREPFDFRRLWTFDLAYRKDAFLDRHVSDVQIVLAKPKGRGFSKGAG
jgi:hypothetical protein